jgi:hypothetical protein
MARSHYLTGNVETVSPRALNNNAMTDPVSVMTRRLGTRCLLVALLSASLLPLTGCSKRTSFVLINASGRPIEVSYKLKHSIDPRREDMGLHVMPAVKAIPEVGEQTPWQELSASEFEVDLGSRTVTVSLAPGKALRIEQLNLRDDPNPAASFNIEELCIKGDSGEVKLQGGQLYASFVVMGYTLTYR